MEILNYIWERLPIIILFANGYVVYRLLVITGLTDIVVRWGIRRAGGRVKWILLYLVAGSAALSLFIPNAVSILALLPILKRIDAGMSRDKTLPAMTTSLTLAAIYGANIGGMGSLIGSPANMLLIGFLDYFKVPGREQINFLSWFVWAIPLVIFFGGLSWLVLTYLGLPGRVRNARVELDLASLEDGRRFGSRPGALLFGVFIGFWILLSFLLQLFPEIGSLQILLCIVFLVAFLFFTFHFRWPGGDGVLVRWSQLISEIPWRGILFLGLLLIFVAVVHILELDKSSAEWYSGFVANLGGSFWIFFGTTLLIIFLTELLSNTVVSTAFFSIAYFTALSQGLPALPLMISVSIASTCAFMTPIATPCNALAFGEMRGTSLRRMLLLGIILNLGGALLMTIWLQAVIPLVYG